MRAKRALNRLIGKMGGYKPYKDEDSAPADGESTPTEAEVLEENSE
jgi:hypothetical protein